MRRGQVRAAGLGSGFLRGGGLLVLGVPMSCTRNGYTEFNAHRVFGFRRLAYIAAGFELVGFVKMCTPGTDGYSSVVILRKPVDGAPGPPLSADDFEAAASRAKRASKKFKSAG